MEKLDKQKDNVLMKLKTLWKVEQFLYLPQCFQNASVCGKGLIFRYELNPFKSAEDNFKNNIKVCS